MRELYPHQETWLPVVGYEDCYEVSNSGRVRSLDRSVAQVNRYGSITTRRLRGRLLAQTVDRGRYAYGRLQVKLAKDGRATTRLVSHLVAEAFIGLRPAGSEVAHGDGNPANNALSNIRYATPKENTEDKFRHGTILRGDKAPAAKLSSAEVAAIKSMAGTVYDLASKFNISIAQVSRIRNGLRRAHG